MRRSRCSRTVTATCSWLGWRLRVPITMAELYPAAAPYFGWDLVRDLQELLRYAFMQHAFEAGTVVALSAGVIGYFVVLRGLSFAAHALSHIGFAGATGAVLVGTTPIVGLLVFTMSAGAVMGALGQRLRGRSIAFMVILAVAVSEAVQVVGVLLIFALIVAPAAIAERFTTRPSRGLLLSAFLAVLFTWAGLSVAYYVPYPVGFFITTIAFGSYILARLVAPTLTLPRRRGRETLARKEQARHSP